MWKNASNAIEQTNLFKANGMQWSELWRLPYWNPSQQLVVDSMHTILEVLVQIHTRELLCLTTAEANSKGAKIATFCHDFSFPKESQTAALDLGSSTTSQGLRLTAKEIKQVSQIHTLLTSPLVEGEGADDDRDEIEIDTDDGPTLGPSAESVALLKTRLYSRNKGALEFVWKDLQLPAGTCAQMMKNNYVDALVEWVCCCSLHPY